MSKDTLVLILSLTSFFVTGCAGSGVSTRPSFVATPIPQNFRGRFADSSGKVYLSGIDGTTYIYDGKTSTTVSRDFVLALSVTGTVFASKPLDIPSGKGPALELLREGGPVTTYLPQYQNQYPGISKGVISSSDDFCETLYYMYTGTKMPHSFYSLNGVAKLAPLGQHWDITCRTSYPSWGSRRGRLYKKSHHSQRFGACHDV